jgi:CheY-like chemotaxis protein
MLTCVRKQYFLVVEDFEDSRFMMRQLLEMAGHTVVEATDGEQAVRVALEEKPAIILMDLSLPKLDGLAAHVRSDVTRDFAMSRSWRSLRMMATNRAPRH